MVDSTIVLWGQKLANLHFWAHLTGGIGIFSPSKQKTKDLLPA